MMEKILPCLHPHPGWGDSKSNEAGGSIQKNQADIVGKHCILELYDCDRLKLNDEAFVRTTITLATKVAGAQLLNLITHRFKPQGITGLALLAESHISIHTWPENGYAAIDVFTCGEHTMPEKACEAFWLEFDAGNHLLKSFDRETPASLRQTMRHPSSSSSVIKY